MIKPASCSRILGRGLPASLAISIFLTLGNGAAAQQVNDAISNYGRLSETDPQGFTLMVVCISLIVLCAFTLIGATAFYALRGNKTR